MKKHKLKGNYRLEKEFQHDYLLACRNDGMVTYRIADVGFGFRFLDAFVIDGSGRVEFVEFKIVDGDSFNVSGFEISQVHLLHELDKRDPNLCRVAIWSKKRDDYVLIGFSEIWEGKNDKGGIKLFRDPPKEGKPAKK